MLCGAIVLLAGCDLPPVSVSPDPTNTPDPSVASPPEPSEVSRQTARHFANVQANLLSQGLLRSDIGGAGEPFGARDLTRNFLRIALYDEYSQQNGELVANPQPTGLSRWNAPIRMQILFGDTVSADQRRRDIQNVRRYVDRLSGLTGLSIRLSNANPNFYVLVLNEDERRAFGQRLDQLVPGISQQSKRRITDMPLSDFCQLHAFAAAGRPHVVSTAIAVIRGEHPDRLRESCFHEEIAQGLGLPNDSPNARPSIFNDDEEFALLTRHDELLLQILYSPSLRLGIREEEAAPIVASIAENLLGGS